MFQQAILLLEDDPAVRESLVWMLRGEGLQVKPFATPHELLASFDATQRGCLVIDLYLPEMSGLVLYGRLAEMGCQLPFIIITGHGEVREATDAMRMGAVDFLEKPIDRKVFLHRIRQAIEVDAKKWRERTDREVVQTRLEALTAREREVLDLVLAGKLTKQIARQLGISTKTVEAHRSNIAKKMSTDSTTQLVRIVTEHLLSHAPHTSTQ